MELGVRVAGRFLLEERIGSGGMGVVYRATDERTGERVALKVLLAGTPEGAERFSREVAALARLSHPAIVRYVAHGESPSFVAMEWLEGEDLARRLRSGPLSIEQAIAIAVRIADALDHAHARGVVHRDIKPANLFLEGGDLARVRVVDFGLAWLREGGDFRTGDGTLLGTPGYMAPEQARGEVTDGRTDIFALGCVVYRCLTGRGPFSARDAVATLAKLLFEDPQPASSVRPNVPRALDEVLAGAMAKDRAQRERSALRCAAPSRRRPRTCRAT
jgi:serine/threonine protein kinase